jgi:hypothetical protein
MHSYSPLASVSQMHSRAAIAAMNQLCAAFDAGIAGIARSKRPALQVWIWIPDEKRQRGRCAERCERDGHRDIAAGDGIAALRRRHKSGYVLRGTAVIMFGVRRRFNFSTDMNPNCGRP